MKPPVRAIFDTNTVISSVVFGKRTAWLSAAWASGAVIPIVCPETTAELLRVLAYPKFRLGPQDRQDALDRYLPYAEQVVLTVDRSALAISSRDPRDDMFLQLAASANAMLVSGDDDLLTLRTALPIISIQQLKSMIDAA